MKNTLLKLLARWGKKLACFSKDRSDRHFLIISTTGIGDTLWATPALKSLKDTFPKSVVIVVTSLLGKEVLAHNPYINELYTVTDPVFFDLFSLYKKLSRYRFATCILFHTSQRAILPFVSMLGIPCIIGNVGMHKGLDDLLSHPITPCSAHHEIERRLALLKPLGVHSRQSQLQVYLSEEDYRLPDLLEKGSWIILHPGASQPFKQWSKASYLHLGKELAAQLHVRIAITGNLREASVCAEIADGIPGAISLAGIIPLRTFAAFCTKASLLITNDTGPMHLAFAQKLPTIAIFSPTNPKFCGPYQIENAYPLYEVQTCFPCIGKKCRDPLCLLQISWRQVATLAIRVYRQNRCREGKNN